MKTFFRRYILCLMFLGRSLQAVLAEVNPAIPVLDLQALLREAETKPGAVVQLPAGTFRVPPHGVTMRGAKGVTIDGSRTTLIFTQFQEDGIRFDECDGVTVKGVTIDYDPLPFTQGTIVALSPDHASLDVEIQAGYPDLTKEYNSSRIHLFDGKTLGWKRGCAEGFYQEVQYLSSRKARVTLEPSMLKKGQAGLLQVGDMVVFSMRRASAIQFFRSRHIAMEDVRLYASPGVTVSIRNADGENRFVRCKVERGPRPAQATVPRLLSANADAFNYGYSRRGPLVEGCEFSFMGDDGINLHGPTFMVLRKEEPNVIWCLRRTSLDQIKRFYDDIIVAGDLVRILDANNFAIQKTVKVVRLETDLVPPFTLTRNEILKANNFANYPKEKYLRITLSDGTGVKAGQMIDFPASNSSGFVIRNNRIHDVRPRGMRIMASNGVIEGNYIARTTQPAISLGGHYAYYREAGWVHDVIVRNNVIEDIGIGSEIGLDRSPSPAAISVYAEIAAGAPAGTASATEHRNIQIVGNKIMGCTVEGIVVSGLGAGTISNNTLSHCNTASPQAALDGGKVPRGYAITVMNSSHVAVENNKILEPEAYPTGSVWVQSVDAIPIAK